MTLRISGLSTGFDTDTAIKEMMTAYRQPYNRLLQKKTVMEWQRDAYREMNTKLTDFRNSKLFKYKLESTFNSNAATVTGNTSAITATVTAASTPQTLQVEVTSLAKSATKYSTTAIGNSSFNANDELADQAANLNGSLMPGATTIQINGTNVTVNPATDTLNAVLNRITNTTNVSAFYDSVTGKVTFNAKNSGLTNGPAGNQAHISFTDSNSFLADVLKIDVATNTPGTDSIAGTDAVLTVNGMATTRSSNSFEINGTRINLLNTTGGTPATITVKQDIDTQVDTIKKFIADYNEALSLVQSKIKEPRYRDFLPLSQEEKEAMKDSDVEKYEKKAQSGMLRNDSILSLLESKMRTHTLTPVVTGSSTYKTLSSIGIDTGSYSDNGKLQLKSESKLRAALAADPNAVKALFNQAGNGDSNTNDVGIVNRLYDQVKSSIDSISKKAGTFGNFETASSIGSQLSRLNKEILRKNEYLTDLENKLYRQFARMERAMSDFNSQSAYLGNNIAAMNNK